jgi:hypothetical protein
MKLKGVRDECGDPLRLWRIPPGRLKSAPQTTKVSTPFLGDETFEEK